MTTKKAITAERVRELMTYDPETGLLRWLVAAGRGYCRKQIGDIAGYISSTTGYCYIGIDGREYGAQRLAWLWMTGRWPLHQIDHRDMDRANNRWSNLREATKSQNMANANRRVHNTSGLKGVSLHKQNGTWVAQIGRGTAGGKHYIGSFDCKAAAYFAYLIEAAKRYGEFARP
jgi:hypothetical protein